MNKNPNGWLARKIPVALLMARIGAPGSGRAWQWQGPRRVVSPAGRVYDVKMRAGIWLRPNERNEENEKTQ